MADLDQQDWQRLLAAPLSQRGQYSNEDDQLQYVQVSGKFLGTPMDEDEYLEFLYTFIHDSPFPIHHLDKELDKTISNDVFQAIQKIMNIHHDEKGLSINRFVAFMEGERLLPLKEKGEWYRHYRSSYIQLLQVFQKNHPDLLHPDFRRIIVDTVKWSWNHISLWLEDMDLREEVPRVLWYGDASKSQSYFLYFLFLLGFDVLLFHPEGKDILTEFKDDSIPVFTYPTTKILMPFPEEKPVRKSTVAKKASEEMEKVLHSDNSLLYRPWQFRSYKPQSITLKTTYDEIFLIMREKAFIRPSFEVKKDTVYIPSIFAKIFGVSTNQKEYWSRIHELTDYELTSIYTRFPITKPVKGNQLYHYQNALTDGKLDPMKMVKGNWWRYRQMPEGLQLGIASAISRYVDKASLTKLEHETEEQLRLYMFAAVMELPESITKLLQQYDYSQTVPRLVIYNNGNSGDLSRSDAALLLLLNELGIDIVLYNPTGQNDIELFIDSNLFDAHWLEEISFEEDFEKHRNKPGTIIKKFIHKLF
nr:YceG family protein [Bacillus sp. FJAT-49736]